MSMIVETRNEMDKLMADQSEEELSMSGTHPAFGALSILEWLDFFLLHEAHHVYLAMRLLSR